MSTSALPDAPAAIDADSSTGAGDGAAAAAPLIAAPEPPKTQQKVRKLKQHTNAAARALSDGGELLNKVKGKVTELGKRVLEVPLGQRLNRSQEQMQQKARFKLLHKRAHAIATAGAGASASLSWTPDTPVDRELFVQQCKKDLNEQLERHRAKVANEGKGGIVSSVLSGLLAKDAGLVFLRPVDGKKLHFFNVEFFNAAQAADEDPATTAPVATITWNAFKTEVFDAYIKKRAAKIKTVEGELVLLKKLDRSFSQILSETGAPGDDKVSLVQLRNRLQGERLFEVADSFWANPIWNKEHEQDQVTRSDFLKTAGGHDSIEALELILLELKEDFRSEVSSKDLVLVAPAAAGTGAGASAATAAAEPAAGGETKKKTNAAETSKRATSAKAAKAVRLEAKLAEADSSVDTEAGIHDLPRREILKGLLLGGIASELARDFDRFTQPVRESLIVLGRQVSAKLKGKEESAAKYAFLNLGTMIANKIDSLKDDLAHLKAALSATAGKMKQVTAEERQALQEQYDKLAATIQQSELEKEHVDKIVRNKYRTLLLAKQRASPLGKFSNAGSSLAHKQDQTPALLPAAISAAAFDIELRAVPFELQSSTAATAAPAASADLVLDFTSTLHEVFDVPAAASVSTGTALAGFVYAIITIKEWQAYLGTRSMERLSLDFLARLVNDFQPDKSLQSAADALTKVQTFGLLSDAEYREFALDPKGVSSKTLAAIKVKAIQRTIDGWASVNSLNALRDALARYGPLLITLPNVAGDKRIEGFWRATAPVSASASESKRGGSVHAHTATGAAQEWEHLVVTAISDRTKKITVRFCLGKQWGCFGQADIGFDELFHAKTGLVTRKQALITALLDKSLL